MDLKPIPEPESDYDVKLLADIEQYGWAVQVVMETEGEPAFAYTIGLVRNFDHPELIIVGLKYESMFGILDVCGVDVRNGRRFEDGKVYDDCLEGYAAIFRSVPKFEYRNYIGYACWFDGSWDIPVLQLIYPDKEGRWPWDEGVTPGFLWQQPVLADRRE